MNYPHIFLFFPWDFQRVIPLITIPPEEQIDQGRALKNKID